MKKNNNAAWGMLVTLLGGILWGFSGTCGQYIFQQEAASSQWVTCVRMLGAGVVLIALGLAKQGRSYAAVWRNKKDAAGLLLFAVLGLMFSQYTYMTAISYSNSGTTTALQCTGQVLVLITAASWFIGGPPGWRAWAWFWPSAEPSCWPPTESWATWPFLRWLWPGAWPQRFRWRCTPCCRCG